MSARVHVRPGDAKSSMSITDEHDVSKAMNRNKAVGKNWQVKQVAGASHLSLAVALAFERISKRQVTT